MAMRFQRHLRATLVALASLSAVAPAAFGETQRIRVAILDFKDYPDPEAKGLGASFGRLLGVALSSDQAVGRRLQFVERSELRQVMAEKKLATAGVLDPATIHTSGRLLGVSYFITGGIDAFSKRRDRKGVPPFKADVLEARATITVRFVDTRTGAQELALQADAKFSDKVMTMDTKDPNKKAEWSATTEDGVLDELLKRAAKQALQELKKQDRLRALKPIEVLGRVVRVEHKRAWVNLGAEAGVPQGARFQVLRLGKPLVDRTTGIILGSDESDVDAGEVETVAPLFSVLRLQRGLARVNDLVRALQPAAPVATHGP